MKISKIKQIKYYITLSNKTYFYRCFVHKSLTFVMLQNEKLKQQRYLVSIEMFFFYLMNFCKLYFYLIQINHNIFQLNQSTNTILFLFLNNIFPINKLLKMFGCLPNFSVQSQYINELVFFFEQKTISIRFCKFISSVVNQIKYPVVNTFMS